MNSPHEKLNMQDFFDSDRLILILLQIFGEGFFQARTWNSWLSSRKRIEYDPVLLECEMLIVFVYDFV